MINKGTGLPLLISNASSSAGVKLAGGGPPPVPATSVFFLVAAIKKTLWDWTVVTSSWLWLHIYIPLDLLTILNNIFIFYFHLLPGSFFFT